MSIHLTRIRQPITSCSQPLRTAVLFAASQVQRSRIRRDMSSTSTSGIISIPPPGVRNPNRRTIQSSVMGDSMTYTHYSYETKGAFTQFDTRIRPGYDNPPHWHTLYQETFTCNSGTLTVTVNGQTRVLRAGDSATVPIGIVHSLTNASDGEVAFTCKLEPGCEGFEKGMYIAHGLANDGATNKDGLPRNPLVLALLPNMMDTWFSGWLFWATTPLFALMRRTSQGLGYETALVEKYWNS